MSTIDKDKEKEEMQRQKKREKKEKQKHTEEENLKKVELQQSEKIRLNFVFNQLCELENEKSSDDDSSSKKYLREINEKAKKKQMKFPKTKNKSKIETLSKKNYKNKDEEESSSKKENSSQKKKFSQKALRKIIRQLCNEFAKDELDNMIWEVDENLDGYVSEDEFENMYKKCITDENEEESKKLFYLTQFLMYDKDQKHEITVEDTLEILCARHQNNVDQALDAIFDIEKVDEKGKKRKIKRETISFLEYAQRMHELSMKKRNEISNIKKTFCDNLKQEALKEAKERAERKNFEENQL
jgi:calmodulin